MECDLTTPIPEWIIEHPETQPVFEELGLEVSCGGKSLEYACHRQGIDPAETLKRLRQVMGQVDEGCSSGGA